MSIAAAPTATKNNQLKLIVMTEERDNDNTHSYMTKGITGTRGVINDDDTTMLGPYSLFSITEETTNAGNDHHIGKDEGGGVVKPSCQEVSKGNDHGKEEGGVVKPSRQDEVSKGTCTSNEDDERALEERKRQSRLARNRQTAKKRRDSDRLYLERLQTEKIKLEQMNNYLKREGEELKKQHLALSSTIHQRNQAQVQQQQHQSLLSLFHHQQQQQPPPPTFSSQHQQPFFAGHHQTWQQGVALSNFQHQSSLPPQQFQQEAFLNHPLNIPHSSSLLVPQEGGQQYQQQQWSQQEEQGHQEQSGERSTTSITARVKNTGKKNMMDDG